MRNDKKVEYQYWGTTSRKAKQNNISGPTTTSLGKNEKGDVVIGMFVEDKMGSVLHETRHGGQIARREIDPITFQGYGIWAEIDAYRAQYSWEGKLEYLVTPTENDILKTIQDPSYIPGTRIIKRINDINESLIHSIVDPGYEKIYNFK